MQTTSREKIVQHVNSFSPSNFLNGVIFHDPSSAVLSSPFPFVAVIPVHLVGMVAQTNLTDALRDISKGIPPSDVVSYRGGKDNQYFGFSGKCKSDFRDKLDEYRTKFFRLPIHHLSTGPTPNSRYISVLTLRDCVEAVSARINDPRADWAF